MIPWESLFSALWSTHVERKASWVCLILNTSSAQLSWTSTCAQIHSIYSLKAPDRRCAWTATTLLSHFEDSKVSGVICNLVFCSWEIWCIVRMVNKLAVLLPRKQCIWPGWPLGLKWALESRGIFQWIVTSRHPWFVCLPVSTSKEWGNPREAL